MNKVSFIVLERLGHNLEMNVDYEPDADIYQVYEDLGHMFDHADVRYANILRLSKSPLALSGQKCPFHNCVHLYRVVDFDRATKTDFTVKGYNARTEVDLGMLCKGTKGMARGTIVGP
ncbi:hypothetical protein A0H81_02069 [Grifola frondosa]|uniref:Protein kinase domain-containing protein n=1 Tax=Grifola frondosa TaxID=5627 RepID=A0A1C7MKC5_GRIFR|nr:hypothetical protein A0H81_02069 [Grifola frondosa]